MTFAFPFVVVETTGPQRSITLQGRSLPYQEVDWGGTQRVNVNYFPGNPVANAQVIGQTYKPTIIRGKWKDTFLFGGGSDPNVNSPSLTGFPPIGAPGLPPSQAASPGAVPGQTFSSGGAVPGGQFATRARTVRDAFELIRRAGQLLRVEWGSLVRFGYLTDASFLHDREEDIAWELEFTWTGDTDQVPNFLRRPSFDSLLLLKDFRRDLQELLNTLQAGLQRSLEAVRRVTQQVRQVGTLVTQLIEVLQRFATLALVPQEVIGTARQQLTAIAQAVNELRAQVRSTPAALISGAVGESITAANLATAFAKAISFNASVIGARAIQQRREFEQLVDNALLGIYVSPGNVTLRDVAARFYGSPNSWTLIAEFNNFATSVVPRGTVVRVPRVDGNV